VYHNYMSEDDGSVDSEICVHKGESWTHPHNHTKLVYQQESSAGELKRSGGR